METTKEQSKFQKKEKLLGYIIICLAIIGAISVVVLGVKGVQYLFDDSDERLKYQKFIATVVMQDPPEFDSVADCSNDFLLQCGMWSVLIKSDTSRYEDDETGQLMVPAADVDQWIYTLFGEKATVAHHSFGDGQYEFTYNEETALYTVPASGYLGYYTPYVTEIKEKNGKLELKVGYVSTTNMASAEINGQVYIPDVDKYETYVLEKNSDGEYYISAIKPYKE